MADRSLEWEVEHIPESDFLFRRVHLNYLDKEDIDFIPPATFRVSGEGISVEWEKYATATESLKRAYESNKNGIIQIKTGDVRNIEPLNVIHSPLKENRAHSNIIGLENLSKSQKIKVRFKLSQYASWVIKIKLSET